MTDPLSKAMVPVASRLFEPAAVSEAVRMLAEALGDDWAVEAESDCDGQVSIIALPVNDEWGTATFIIFERGDRPHIAMIRQDQWEWDRGFTSVEEAVNALAETARASNTEPVQRASRVPVAAP